MYGAVVVGVETRSEPSPDHLDELLGIASAEIAFSVATSHPPGELHAAEAFVQAQPQVIAPIIAPIECS